MGIADRRIEDSNLVQALEKLTPRKIKAAFDAVVKAEAGARLKAYYDSCMRCGMCAQACHFSLSHPDDPSYTPIAKKEQSMWRLIRADGNVTTDEVYGMAQIAFTECNMCKRCAHYCPVGIDTGYIISLVRRFCFKLGMVPTYIQDTANSHSAVMNQMWVKEDEWIDSLMWQEDEARSEFPYLRIPLDKEGSDILYSVIAPEPKFRTQLIYQAAAIMHEAGVDWTMPSSPGWDNSDMCMFIGDLEMMGRLKRCHYEMARRLKVRRIVMGECGHAFRSVYDTGNRWLGYRDWPIRVVHSVEFFWELLTAGKIKIPEKMKEPVTIHDPCNITRGYGLMDKLREVVHMLCENVVEMSPNREHTICCCAGGGIINCGPPFKGVRVAGNRAKADQLAATGVHYLVAPCHNCHGGLEDIINNYKLDMHTKFLGDLIYQLMEKTRAE